MSDQDYDSAEAPKKKSRIPAHAPKPQDHKPPKKTAAQREADGDDMVDIDFHGTTFSIIADMDDWPILAHQAFSKQLAIDAVEHLLGPRQWAMFHTRFPKKRQFEEFATEVASAFGFGNPGE